MSRGERMMVFIGLGIVAAAVGVLVGMRVDDLPVRIFIAVAVTVTVYSFGIAAFVLLWWLEKGDSWDG